VSDGPIIEVDGLEKSFGDKRVYEGLSLTVGRGEALCIVGGSGSGKSVLLRMIIGLERPDRGSMRFDGQDLSDLDEAGWAEVRTRVAMMFQNGALFDSLSVADNVAYPLRQRRQLDEATIAERVRDRLALVDLPDAGELFPAALSGGMKKRVALARAIVAEPEVLLLDEPTAGLDPPTTRKIDELMRAVHRDLGITLVVVTHDLPSAYLVSDRIAMLKDGRIVAEMPSAEFARSDQEAVHEFAHAMRVEVT
jgi:phospholipid/cholesterol/gamma-HCH transport system ATP-binding protein